MTTVPGVTGWGSYYTSTPISINYSFKATPDREICNLPSEWISCGKSNADYISLLKNLDNTINKFDRQTRYTSRHDEEIMVRQTVCNWINKIDMDTTKQITLSTNDLARELEMCKKFVYYDSDKFHLDFTEMWQQKY